MADMRCPHCEGGVRVGIKKSLDVAFLKERITALVGDEYTLESTALHYNVPIVIRHNKCGYSQTYSNGKFLAGRRCTHCHIPITKDAKHELISYLSNGEYEALTIGDNRICQLRNCLSGQEYKMDFDYAVQELIRPTPSPTLPCKNPNRAIDAFAPTPTDYFTKILIRLKSTYEETEVLFKEDIEAHGADALQMKRFTNKLVRNHIVERFYPGIYKWYGADIPEYEVIFQRYIRRKGAQIGYLYGQSFAHEIGLADQKPDRIYITTNKEANLHGRSKAFLGFELYLRGSKAFITEENWRILQLLDLLPNLGQYVNGDDTQTDALLRKYIHESNLTYDHAIPYLHLYPSWVESRIQKLTNPPSATKS